MARGEIGITTGCYPVILGSSPSVPVKKEIANRWRNSIVEYRICNAAVEGANPSVSLTYED